LIPNENKGVRSLYGNGSTIATSAETPDQNRRDSTSQDIHPQALKVKPTDADNQKEKTACGSLTMWEQITKKRIAWGLAGYVETLEVPAGELDSGRTQGATRAVSAVTP
jgi:hypothetical protein